MQEVQVPLPVGSVVRGHYLIERLLGRGCASAVYLVSDRRSKHGMPQHFVLKEVVASNKDERSRLIFEGILLRRLRHQGFPRIYHVFSDGNYNRVYLLMEYIEGPSLEDLRQRRPEKRFSWLEAVPLIAPVIDAVGYLYSQQPSIIHRDIKPANIIVSEARTVLVDFGMIEVYEPTLPSAAVLPFVSAYRAPEQYSGEIDRRTDVYGLGATFYTLVTGMVPVDALSRTVQAGNGEPDPLRPIKEVIPSVPAHVARVIDRAIALHPYERFSSVERFWEALWESVNVSPVELPSGVPDKLPSVSSPRPDDPGRAPAFENSVAMPLQKQPHVKRLPLFVSARLGVLMLLGRIERFWEVLRPPRRRWSAMSVGTQSATSPRPEVTRPAPLAAQPVPAPVPVSQPSAPPARKGGAFWPFVRKRTGEQPTTVSASKPRRASRAWKPGIVLVLFALLIGLGIVSGFSSHVPDRAAPPLPTVTAVASGPTRGAPTAVSTTYPLIAGTYTGTIDDLSSNVSTSLSLTRVQQSQGKISGYLVLGSGLPGSGPFRGTIDTTKHLQFTVTDAAGSATLFFQGAMQSATSLSGDYYACRPGPVQSGQCRPAPRSYGIWGAVLVS